ncbi:unnamed protein product [Anisakis simplex]|uniref:PQQ_3 domain-containing protein n=1 Tax=Anisakis simplex TaxID=6269 RepID=A0A0M3K3U2_ANISI|nr:unnamed protein product [Anisakis simplex]
MGKLCRRILHGEEIARKRMQRNWTLVSYGSVCKYKRCDANEDGTVLWETQLKAPVFASPLMVDDGNVEKLLIVDVKGNIYSYEPFTAMKIDQIATEEGVFAAPVMLSKQIGVVVTQNSSVIIIHVQSLAVLVHLKIGSSPFVRSPFIDTSIDTLFLLNTTGQLFELKFNEINFTSPHSTNTAESLRSKDDHELIQRVNPAHRVEIRRQTDSSVRHLNSKSSLANSIELSSSHASDSSNTINQSEANVNKLIRSVDLILSQNTETFGGVLIMQEKFCDQAQCIVYRALIGSRNDRLGCFIFTRKVV